MGYLRIGKQFETRVNRQRLPERGESRIAMAVDYHPATAPDTHPLAPALSYWNRLRRDGRAPARADLDPGALHPYLASAGIVEWTSTGLTRFRLAGRALQRLVGMELRGMPLRALFVTDSRRRLEGLLPMVFGRPQVLTMTLLARMPNNGALTAHLALMPLCDTQGAVTRALLILSPDRPSNHPCRFHIRQAHFTPINASGRVPDAPKGKPQLTLIQGGKT